MRRRLERLLPRVFQSGVKFVFIWPTDGERELDLEFHPSSIIKLENFFTKQ